MPALVEKTAGGTGMANQDGFPPFTPVLHGDAVTVQLGQCSRSADQLRRTAGIRVYGIHVTVTPGPGENRPCSRIIALKDCITGREITVSANTRFS
jgi:hypothetical protein